MAADLISIGRRQFEPPATPSQPAAVPGSDTLPMPGGLETYRIETWGCQMNEHDSEKMEGALLGMGLRPAPAARDADVVLLNTCSVREKAAHKVFTRLGQLRRLKMARPHMVIGVCGCVAQQEQDSIFARAPFVDLVMGPRRIASLPRLIEESSRRRRAMAVFDPHESLIPETGAIRRVSRTKAYVTVMEGCNKGCTFCIVPMTRGREVCRPPEAILEETRACIAEGLPEVELLGQNVNAWRHGADPGWDFARLLAAVATEPGVRRLRFTTSHPLHFRDPIIDVMAAHDTIARHLHLPVQSGSDRILKLMKRGHTAAEYRNRIARLRRSLPDIALSTDVIVGFPGETEEDFRLTLDLVEEVGYGSVYSFVYSPRPGTPAAELADDVPSGLKKERLQRLQAMQQQIQIARNRAREGSIVEVLIEGPAARAGGQVSGRTSQNQIVNLDGGPWLVGRFVRVRIVRAGPNSLAGEAVEPLTSAGCRDHDVGVH